MASVQDRAVTQLSAIEAEIAKAEQDILVKKAVAASLRAILGTSPAQVSSRSPAQAVKSIVSANPDGILLATITDQLEDVIETQSSNPRRIIQNTVNQLSSAGHITVFEKGGKKYAKPR